MTYYCELRLSNCKSGGYEVRFPDVEGAFSQGDDKDHALTMAKEGLEGNLSCCLDNNINVPLPVNRSDEGLFPIEVDSNIAKRILQSKIQFLQKEFDAIDSSEVSANKTSKQSSMGF